MKTLSSCGETGSSYVTSFSGFIGICHLLFSRDFKRKKCLLKIANSAVSNLRNCDCRWMWPKWRSLYDSVNYGFSELWGRVKSRRRIWQSHILFFINTEVSAQYRLAVFEFLSAKCSYSGFSGVEFRLRSPEVERKYSEGCSDRILKPIQMWYIYTLFDGLAYNTCGYFASCVVF